MRCIGNLTRKNASPSRLPFSIMRIFTTYIKWNGSFMSSNHIEYAGNRIDVDGVIVSDESCSEMCIIFDVIFREYKNNCITCIHVIREMPAGRECRIWATGSVHDNRNIGRFIQSDAQRITRRRTVHLFRYTHFTKIYIINHQSPLCEVDLRPAAQPFHGHIRPVRKHPFVHYIRRLCVRDE